MSTNANVKQLSDLFVRLPMCKADGSNYVLYRDRFLFAADAAALGHHLELMTTSPAGAKPIPADPAAVTTAEQDALDKWELKDRVWRSEQAIVKQGIAATIPDALFLKVKGETTAARMWGRVKAEFEKRSQMMVVDLRRKLQHERCTENGDVKTHLSKLQAIREDLIAMGADPGDDNFVAILLGSLPASYDPYLAALTAASTLLATPLSVDTYIRGISDEADRRSIRQPPKEVKEAAFHCCHVCGRKEEEKKDDKKGGVECFNCGKRGHMKKDCWAKGGGKEGQGPRDREADEARGAFNDSDGVWYANDCTEFDDWKDEAEDSLVGVESGMDWVPETSGRLEVTSAALGVLQEGEHDEEVGLHSQIEEGAVSQDVASLPHIRDRAPWSAEAVPVEADAHWTDFTRAESPKLEGFGIYFNNEHVWLSNDEDDADPPVILPGHCLVEARTTQHDDYTAVFMADAGDESGDVERDEEDKSQRKKRIQRVHGADVDGGRGVCLPKRRRVATSTGDITLGDERGAGLKESSLESDSRKKRGRKRFIDPAISAGTHSATPDAGIRTATTIITTNTLHTHCHHCRRTEHDGACHDGYPKWY